MVCRQHQNGVRVLLHLGDHAADGLVHRFDRGDRGFHHAGVADHVTVGEVADDDGILVGGNGLDELVGDLGGAHLRDQVVGRELLRGRHQAAVFALELLFHAAVEEEGDVGVLLGLGHAELLEAVLADDVAKGVHQFLGRVSDGQRQGLVVLRGADVAERIDGLLALEAVKVGQVQRPGHLTGAVGTEVHEDDAVALVDDALGADDDRLDEFVRHIGGIACLHSVNGVGIQHAFAADDGVIAGLDAVPALVAVHAPEAALQGGDLRVAEAVALVLQLLDEARTALRGDVASVEEAVDVDLFQAARLGHVEDAEDVLDVAVHAAAGEQAHDVQGLAVCFGVFHGLDIDLVFKELSGFDLLAHLGQDLEHDAAGTDVGVADLGVAHLALRQADVKAGGLQLGVGIFGKELVQVGLLRLRDRIARGGRGDTEAVQDHENCFFVHGNLLIRSYGADRAAPYAIIFYWLEAAMMVAKSTGLREAPPMRPPSMSG